MPAIIINKTSLKPAALVLLAAAMAMLVCASGAGAKLLGRRSHYYDDPYLSRGGPGGAFGGPYGMPTGDRAILTVRGARNTYDGSAPSKLIIEDQPYLRGPYPRGIYDRLDRPYGASSRPIGGFGGYGGGWGDRYPNMGGYGLDAPPRIAVTGAYPVSYGRRPY